MNSISELTKEYTAVLQKVQERRACWQTKSKPFLIQFLSGITEQHKLNWKAGANELMLGLEAVYLVFDHEPSGIVEQSPFSVVQKNEDRWFPVFFTNPQRADRGMDQLSFY